jgi:hypothetical protein
MKMSLDVTGDAMFFAELPTEKWKWQRATFTGRFMATLHH